MTSPTASQTWCKICGVTSVDDAQACVTAGADAIGLQCYDKSPRYIDASRLAEIGASVDVTRVALFVDASAAQVDAVLATGVVDLLQFHGNETPEFCRSFGVPYMKVLRMQADTDIEAEASDYASAWALLLDTYVPGLPGGTGQAFDWSLWPQYCDLPLVLAGGLTPQNVGSAVAQLEPFGVDVCGGVEGAVKGQKDLAKVTQFVKEVRSVSGR